jgi:hypothetical protein
MSEGSQFPCTEQHGCNSGWSGMTLRDYFAAKALHSAWMAYQKGYFESTTPNRDIARCAYQLADAMLEQRDKYK